MSDPLPALTEIETKVRALAAVVGAEGNALPTFGRTDDGARPHIEVNDAGMHFVVVERGQELLRETTRDLDMLLWFVFESITSSLAVAYELRNRVYGKDSRRGMFARQVELLNRLSPAWAMREITQQVAILAKYPFDDVADIRAQYTAQLRSQGHASDVAWTMACEKYPPPQEA